MTLLQDSREKGLVSFQITDKNANIDSQDNQKGRNHLLHTIRKNKNEAENFLTFSDSSVIETKSLHRSHT